MDWCEIPVIDFSTLSVAMEDDELDPVLVKQTGEQIVQAFSTVGFVYISNTGLPDELIDEAMASGKKFFDLPEHIKRKYRYRVDKGDKFGWHAFEQERVNTSVGAGDLRECFDFSVQCLHCDECWPSEVPDLKSSANRFFFMSSKLAKRVLISIAEGLHLSDRDYFGKNHHIDAISGNTHMRLLWYPALAENAELKPNQERLGEHTDYGSITLLFQDNNGGLQIRRRDGQWIDASPIAGTVLVNIADLLQRWTCNKLISTPHRVLTTDGETKRRQNVRRSIALFVHPDPDVIVAPFDGTDEYPPVKAGEYLHQRLLEINTY